MDSPQSVVSPFKTSVISEPEKHKIDYSVQSSVNLPNGIDVSRKEAEVGKLESFIGVLNVYIHQARDIHNICIYHKQDVYAKLCLTSDPQSTVSTKIINGGGRNPVFNDQLQLNVRTIDSSLKCEIFMMSRVKNYLEDQLLGFALVPLSEVLMKNGNLEKEFSLSSTDLFHSPAGFVQLSLSYAGASPEVMAIPAMPTALAADGNTQNADSVPCELDKIEFPDPKIVNEDQMMVSEYIGISCSNLDSESCDSLAASDAGNCPSEVGVNVVESFSAATVDSAHVPKLDSPPSSVSTNGVSSPSAAASSEASDAPAASKTQSLEHDSARKDIKSTDAGDGETASSGEAPKEKNVKPVITVNVEPEPNVVQQDIVDMYMKSMQQFTESLAKMKLPLDIDSGPTSSGSSSSDQKTPASKNNGSRIHAICPSSLYLTLHNPNFSAISFPVEHLLSLKKSVTHCCAALRSCWMSLELLPAALLLLIRPMVAAPTAPAATAPAAPYIREPPERCATSLLKSVSAALVQPPLQSQRNLDQLSQVHYHVDLVHPDHFLVGHPTPLLGYRGHDIFDGVLPESRHQIGGTESSACFNCCRGTCWVFLYLGGVKFWTHSGLMMLSVKVTPLQRL
ncbi:hypothetical protein Tsubulata_031609 [Turnera subulata]|uniref:C2 domain-containing protein n=1 Tax=Turnera subulata TaxID=218843 RepID=A0A9Q0FDK3_9ROSI|nr:hypothetical protein Tsubulata_031609 [Turnera subulata]